MLYYPQIVLAQIKAIQNVLANNHKMSEFMLLHPSHFRCIKSAVSTGLRKMYIDGSCPGLGIDIKISGLSVGPAVIDPNRMLNHEV